MRWATLVVLTLVAGVAAGCSGRGHGAEPVDASSCGRMLYEGEGKPDVVIVSDAPVRGIGAKSAREKVAAIELVLRRRNFRAGTYRVGYQSCTDTVGTQAFDPLLCRQNARAYVRTKDVVGIIGPWNSGCAVQQIPTVSRKSAGPLVMVSPANTYIGLTRTTPRTARRGDGAALYPDGIRSYARVLSVHETQGVAAAQLAARLGARRVVVLHHDLEDDYVFGLAVPFVRTASDLGLSVRRLVWRKQRSYEGLAAAVAAARPEAVYLAGLTEFNAKRLLEDLRAAVGQDTVLIAPDSFAGFGRWRALGPVGEGLYVTELGIAADRLPPAGRRVLRALGLDPARVGPTEAPEAAQATEVLLDAIARSDGSRASVVREVFATKVTNGILGSFSFDRRGDIVPAPVTIYRVHNGKLVTERVVRVPLAAIDG